ncbi:MAG: glycosyltransferase family 2 protein [Paracoccus sp. (in: a-proteobacteria)]|uniref:glycosyltransferase family 2 protein n=1 Tax=Paracoccus sp. TaxID=267 RepID=UPI0026DF0064|nr:glycosyltransferase family 2 protein [Paracoccus sp. (in: a-proteobacteria)]MDO5620908.1 glycosyltransferase family 2 protein [Paracoccus sp. (in: a-proteobacteria)]
MAVPSTILRQTITARPLGQLCNDAARGGALLAAVPVADLPGQARLYFSDGIDADALIPEGQGNVRWSRIVSGAAVMDLEREADGQVKLPLAGCDALIRVEPSETGLFAGRNVILGHCNNETPEVLRDWLLWHRRQHRADAALVIDRAAPGHADDLVADLSRLLADDPAAADDLAGMIVMVVDCDMPLGDAARGAEQHPMNAPDAPGKDRMEQPAPDPWHAPLSYRLLFDLIRAKFLASARAVANLELMDLVAPPDERGSIFDMAQDMPMGVLPLRGERVYPWGLRKGTEPGFGDHICRRFDAQSAESRWCVAPARMPSGTIWMMLRILGAKTSAPPWPFWRFMALRHGIERSKVGQIVPKSSLIEDDRLLTMAEALGAKPLRIPADEAAARAEAAKRTDHVAIVTTMKNEGPFILEWIAYHRAIGVRDFLVYTNDCTDGTDELLQLLERKGYLQWRDNPYREVNMKPQHAALDAANNEPIIQNADWVICMDVDEYIAIHTGDGTMKALFDAVPDANMISCTWRLFGNADVDEYKDEFITQIFTRAAREFANKPHQAWGFKTLYRNDGLFKKLGVHRPKGLMPQAVDRINWVNGSGKLMPKDQWRNAWRSHSGTYGYDLVALNHYAVRSAESFLVKRDRGRVNHVDRDQGMAYWFRMNHNVVEDTRMHRILPLLQAEYDRMMADPEIAAMHLQCVEAHKAKIGELKAQPNYQAFHTALNSDRTRKLTRLHGHFGSNVYIAGPEVVPDDVVARDPDDDFFFTVEYSGETQH